MIYETFVGDKQFSVNWSQKILDLTLLCGPQNLPNFDSNKHKILDYRKKSERPDNMGHMNPSTMYIDVLKNTIFPLSNRSLFE